MLSVVSLPWVAVPSEELLKLNVLKFYFCMLIDALFNFIFAYYLSLFHCKLDSKEPL